MRKKIDILIEKIKEKQNPSCIGLDTSFDYLPDDMRALCNTLKAAADAIFRFNADIIDACRDIIPAVKVQAAYYEMYGDAGMKAFRQTLKYAKKCGLVTIADVKRCDIGSTAECYARAYLGKTQVGERVFCGFDSDFITVSPYLGTDGLMPFVEACKASGKGVFMLVKTSNPSSSELQDQTLQSGQKLYEQMADTVTRLGKELVGRNGFSSVGAVVGATYPGELAALRAAHKKLFMLIPGYGAQGGTAANLAPCFAGGKIGGIVNSSRAILLAYRSDKYKGFAPANAARAAALEMKNDLKGLIIGDKK